MNTVDYSARSFWVKATLVNEHIHIGPRLSQPALDHVCDLMDEVQCIASTSETVRDYAMMYASTANDRLMRVMGGVGQANG